TFEPRLPDLAPDDLPWWNKVDPAERVSLLPAIGPERGTVLAMFGGWGLLLLAGLSVRLSSAVLASWLSLLIVSGTVAVVMLRRYLRARSKEQEFRAQLGAQRVFGAPD